MKEILPAHSSRSSRISPRNLLQETIHLTDLADLYRQQVLRQRTRTIRLLGRKNPAKIMYTLLGFEVKSGCKRIQCPDMVTARYIRLFSELGCHSIKLPYDPTRTAQLIPQFESMLDRIAKRIRELYPGDLRAQSYAFRKAYAVIRGQLRVP